MPHTKAITEQQYRVYNTFLKEVGAVMAISGKDAIEKARIAGFGRWPIVQGPPPIYFREPNE